VLSAVSTPARWAVGRVSSRAFPAREPPHVAAPPTDGGALVTCVTRAAPRGGSALRPRNEVVPASRPLHDAWRRVLASPVRAGRGGGAAHATGGEPPPRMQAPARGAHPSPGLRDEWPLPPVTFHDAGSRTSRAPFGRKKSSDEDTGRCLCESYCSPHPQRRILAV
jgi:hypothetical protein